MTTPNAASLLVLLLVSCQSSATAEWLPGGSPTPGYNQAIPSKLMTPDRVKTSIGTLEFFDGLPSPATSDKLYDFLDLSRGVDVFLNMVPAASVEALRVGMLEMGVDAPNKVLLYDQLMDSNSLFLTGNTDTVYAIGLLDLLRDGPTVVEIPALAISSTDCRERVAAGAPITYLVPAGVERFIAETSLYRAGAA